MVKTRADTKGQRIILFLPAIFPFIGIIASYIQKPTLRWPDILGFLVLIVFCAAFILYHVKTLKRIWFDESNIYIKHLFKESQEIIAYSDVIFLKERFKKLYPLMGGRRFTLTYKSISGVKRVRFFGSTSIRQTNLLRKRLGSTQQN